jgi:quercetin dioxygenase-like cupin family protein
MHIQFARALRSAALSLCLLVPTSAWAQQPTAGPPQGFNITTLASIDLGPEIEGMQGRVLRMSYVTVAPGSTMAAHPHKDRPEIIYVVQGTLTEQRNNGEPVDHGAGSVLVMTKDVTHALSNRSTAPVVYIATPIAK